jgi:hypothetical protein
VIYVDDLVNYSQAPKPGAERYFGNGKPSCHLTTDGPLDELHSFAARLGLKRAWFQPGPPAHYDLTPNKRRQAIQLGAVAKSIREQVRQQQGAVSHVCPERERPLVVADCLGREAPGDSKLGAVESPAGD